MQDIINIKLEEYIPLKIIFNKDEEAVEYISYSKDKITVINKCDRIILKDFSLFFVR